MSIPPPPERAAKPVGANPENSVSVASAPERTKLGPFLVALIVGCCVMLIATMALGASTFALLRPASADASPTPKPSPTEPGGAMTQTVRGVEVVTQSDLDFGRFAMSDKDEDGYTLLVAPVSWDDETSGVAAWFDFTAYDVEGRIINRHPTSVYILPGQEGFFQGIFSSDLSEAVRITVEQVSADVEAPPMTGEITMTRSETLKEDGKNYVGGNFTSSLSVAPSNADVFIAGYVDGELFGYCSDLPDIPAGGEFVAICALTPVTQDDHVLDDTVPEDAEFRAYLALDPLSETD